VELTNVINVRQDNSSRQYRATHPVFHVLLVVTSYCVLSSLVCYALQDITKTSTAAILLVLNAKQEGIRQLLEPVSVISVFLVNTKTCQEATRPVNFVLVVSISLQKTQLDVPLVVVESIRTYREATRSVKIVHLVSINRM
jgi:hypothetical protein